MERRKAAIVPRSDVSTGLDQRCRDLGLASERRLDQGSLATLVTLIDIGTSSDKIFDLADVARLRRFVQRRSDYLSARKGEAKR
jgi:hypothetical protein